VGGVGVEGLNRVNNQPCKGGCGCLHLSPTIQSVLGHDCSRIELFVLDRISIILHNVNCLFDKDGINLRITRQETPGVRLPIYGIAWLASDEVGNLRLRSQSVQPSAHRMLGPFERNRCATAARADPDEVLRSFTLVAKCPMERSFLLEHGCDQWQMVESSSRAVLL
jgi:hypothetical protein